MPGASAIWRAANRQRPVPAVVEYLSDRLTDRLRLRAAGTQVHPTPDQATRAATSGLSSPPPASDQRDRVG